MITSGVVITVLILAAISLWMIIGRLWPNRIVDETTKRIHLFRYLDALGILLSNNGHPKSLAVYYKAYMSFLATMDSRIADIVADYNKEVIDKLQTLRKDEINQKTMELLNAARKVYRTGKEVMKIYIANLKKEENA